MREIPIQMKLTIKIPCSVGLWGTVPTYLVCQREKRESIKIFRKAIKFLEKPENAYEHIEQQLIVKIRQNWDIMEANIEPEITLKQAHGWKDN